MKTYTIPADKTGLIVNGLYRGWRELSDRFVCAHCGRLLIRYDEPEIFCANVIPHQHTITTEQDVKRRKVARETLERWETDEAKRMLEQGGVEMPVKDRKRRQVGLTRAGIIRLGVKVPVQGKQDKYGKQLYRPADVSYFVLKDAPAVEDAYKDFKTASDKYGSGPSELLVYLPFGELQKNFDGNYELWKGSICHCRGDGEFITRALDGHGVSYVIDDGWAIQDSIVPDFAFKSGQQVPCPGNRKEKWRWPHCGEGKRGCNLSCVLRVMVRDPNEPTRLVADELRYYQIRTHSGVTYDRLSQQMEKYAQMAAQFGMSLPGIPFRLLRIPETMSYVANGKRSTADHALMSLEADEEWARVITELSYKSALTIAAPSAVAALPAGDDVDYEIVDEDTDDGYDHDWAEEEQEHTTEPAPLKDIPRPWDGPTVRRALLEKAARYTYPDTTKPSDKQRGLFVGKLDGLLTDKSSRAEFTDYVFGETSSKNLNRAQVESVLAWMWDGQEYQLNAKAEAGNVIRAGALDRGQTDMFETPLAVVMNDKHDALLDAMAAESRFDAVREAEGKGDHELLSEYLADAGADAAAFRDMTTEDQLNALVKHYK